jgi:putative ABC transport system permease protein
MIKNYFKIALAVLGRRKFFTFISLFGISITLTVLLVATAFLDQVANAHYPDTQRDRILYVTRFFKWSRTHGSINGGNLGYYFITHYLNTLKVPEAIGFASNSHLTNTYLGDKKFSLEMRQTDAHFWDILRYDFLEGKPYSQAQIDHGDRVVVIGAKTRDDYFGRGASALGKYIVADNVTYRVVGVVRDEQVANNLTAADIYLPYSLSKVSLDSRDLAGDYTGFLLAPASSDVPRMRREFNDMFAKVPLMDKDYDHQISWADSYIASYSRNAFGGLGTKDFFANLERGSDGLGWFYLSLTLLVLLFMLIPTLNLININITRIMERSSEIGVRKSFGASSRTLVIQFIIENIFLTLLGALIAVALSLGAIALINRAQPISNMYLSLQPRVLAYGLGYALFFGLLSGVYPAWRMSRLPIVTALKA